MANMLGVMLDCSRNAVMRPEKVVEFASIIGKMGYNTLMLYTEDTYEVENQPYFGYRRGRYSIKELQEMDAACAAFGVTLTPCIQTLAHLNCIFKWEHAYREIKDWDDILLVGAEKTYQLIDDMFASLSKALKARTIHIGMDEAYLVGLGKYLQEHGFRDRFDIINEHLHKVCDIAEKYGYRPMIWSDMFKKLALNTSNQYADISDDAIAAKAALPENVSLVYWDYYSEDYDRYVRMIRTNQKFGRPVIFAGGAWTWKGFSPDNQYSIATTSAAVRACRDCGVEDIFYTVWGDDGDECSKFTILPALLYGAEVLKGPVDMDALKVRFKEIVGVEWDDFMVIDNMNLPKEDLRRYQNSSKYLLYNDPLAGLLDYICDGTEDAYYTELAESLKNLPHMGKFQYIFKKYEALADVLSVKSDLGIRTRALYLAGDKAGLEKLAKETYPEAIRRVNAFYEALRAEWYLENKPQGFEIQDIRLGGVLQRLQNAARLLLEYVEGKIPNLPEVEEPLLSDDCGRNGWAKIVSANVLHH